MPLVRWTPSYSVKVAEIDLQHQKIIAIINELNEAMSKGKGAEILSLIMDKLAAYAQSHFSTEESLFDTHQYPEAGSHKAEHAAFFKKLTNIREEFKKKPKDLTLDVMAFVSSWFTQHVCGTDMKYSDFLNSKGVK